jgi:hypothetical protein
MDETNKMFLSFMKGYGLVFYLIPVTSNRFDKLDMECI